VRGSLTLFDYCADYSWDNLFKTYSVYDGSPSGRTLELWKLYIDRLREATTSGAQTTRPKHEIVAIALRGCQVLIRAASKTGKAYRAEPFMELQSKLRLQSASFPAVARVDMRDTAEEVFRAAASGDLQTLTRLIERGGNVDARHPVSRWTALQQAAYAGHTHVVIFLVEHGANVAAADAIGQTALRHAALRGDLEAVKCLVNHGADVNAATSRGVTALAAAEAGGHHAVVEFLRSKGAR